MLQNVYKITLTRTAKMSAYAGNSTKIIDEIIEVHDFSISENVLGLSMLNDKGYICEYMIIPLCQIIDMKISRIDGDRIKAIM